MEKKKLLEELEKKINCRKKEIAELQVLYLLKYAENEAVQEMFHKINNEVLQSGSFYAARRCQRKGMEADVGDRITDYTKVWMLSDADFDLYQKECAKKYYSEGLTDAQGRYTDETDTEQQLGKIKDRLIRLSVEVLPDSFPNKKLLEDAVDFKGRNSYATREKLFELIMDIK